MKDLYCLKSASEKLVLHLKVVALMHLSFERLIEDRIAWVILNVLPASIAMSEINLQSGKTSGRTKPHEIIQTKNEERLMEAWFYIAAHSL